MKTKMANVEYFIIYMFILSMLFVTTNEVLIFLVLPIQVIAFFNYNKGVKISGVVIFVFLSMFLITLLNFLLNLIGIYDTSSTLTLKVFFNVAFTLSILLISYLYGSSCATQRIKLETVLSIFMNVFLLNAAVNIVSWITQTGGVIDRYNFISPITQSTGGNIILCVLGFFLSLALNKKKTKKFLYCVIFAFNLLIIISRQQQILFIFYSMLIFCLYQKKFRYSKFVFRLLIIMTVILGVFMILMPYLGTYVSYYQALFNVSGDDYMTRKVTHEVSLSLFRSRPITGIGYGTFALFNNESYKWSALASSHSGLLDLLAESGIMGCTVIAILYVYIFKKCVKLNRISPILIDKVAISFILGSILTTYTLHLIVFPPPSQRVYYMYSSIIWFFIGYVDKSVKALRKEIKE